MEGCAFGKAGGSCELFFSPSSNPSSVFPSRKQEFLLPNTDANEGKAVDTAALVWIGMLGVGEYDIDLRFVGEGIDRFFVSPKDLTKAASQSWGSH